MVKVVGSGLDIPFGAPAGTPVAGFNRLGTHPTDTDRLVVRNPGGDLIAVTIKWQGAWDNDPSYVVGDIVELSGSAYIAIQDSQDEAPDTPASPYWELLASKGDNGPLWRGAWFDNIEYHTGDLAEYAGATWIAKQTSTDVQPNSDFDYWQVFAAAGSTGSTGSTGATGATGLVGGAQTWRFTFSTTTTDSDPGSGVMRFNSTPGSTNRIFIDVNDADGTLISNSIDTLDDSTSTIKGFIKVINRAGTKQATYSYTQTIGGAGYYKLVVSILDEGGGAFSNGEEVFLTFSRTGDKGTTGATGPSGTAGGPKTQLVYTQSSDITSLALTSGTWVDFLGSQNFTVDLANSLIEIAVRAGTTATGVGQALMASRLLIDGTTAYSLGSDFNLGNDFCNPFAGCGPVWISGLSAGTHSFKLQVRVNNTGQSISCRPSATSMESLVVTVSEHKLGGLAWVPVGTYSAGTTYAVNEVVTYNGASYVALQGSTGQTPSSSPTYWSLVASKGDQGDAGVSAYTAGGPKLQLNFVESTDLHNGSSLPAATWTTFKSIASFTVDAATSLVEVAIRGSAIVSNPASTNNSVQARLKIDGSVVASISGGFVQSYAGAATGINPFAGVEPIYVSGLSAGTHSLAVELWCNAGSVTVYCRCSTQPNIENFGVQVIEHKLGGAAWLPMGTYSAGTTYAVNEVVTYNGSSYLCIQAGTGQTPSSSPTYWSLIASKGDTGSTGAAGTSIMPPIGIEYVFSTTTTDSDPGNGVLRLNNATQSSATIVRMDSLDAAGVSWASVIDSMDDSPSTTHKGYLRIASKTTPANYLLFSVTLVAAPSGYKNVSVSLILSSASNPLTNGETVVVTYDRNGDSSYPAYLPLTQQGSTGPGGIAGVTSLWADSTYGLPQARIGTASSANPTLRPKNRFHNGLMRLWPKGTSGFTHTTTYSVFTSYPLPRWFVRPTGASNTSQRNAGPGGISMAYMGLQVFGNTSVTAVDVGQRISQEESQLLQAPGGEYTVSFWIWNGTSGVFTPSILINTCNASDNWSALTNRVNTALQSCAINAWTRVSYTFTPSSITNQANGTEICLQFPTTPMNSNTKYVIVTGAMLEEGGAPTAPEFMTIGVEIAQMQGYWYQSYSWGVVQGTNSPQGSLQTQCDGASTNQIPGPHFPNMRKVPSTQVYSVSGTAGSVSTTGLSNAGSSCALQDLGTNGARYISNGSSYSANTAYCYHLVCSAED